MIWEKIKNKNHYSQVDAQQWKMTNASDFQNLQPTYQVTLRQILSPVFQPSSDFQILLSIIFTSFLSYFSILLVNSGNAPWKSPNRKLREDIFLQVAFRKRSKQYSIRTSSFQHYRRIKTVHEAEITGHFTLAKLCCYSHKMQVYNIDKKEGREEKSFMLKFKINHTRTISSIPYRCICMDIKMT